MQAIICNKAHPDYGCATIPLPIPDAEYAHCIGLLEELDVGGVTASDCYIDRLDDAPPALDVLEQQEVNIDELDFLARSLDRYTGEELAKFQSVAAAQDCRELPTLINLSFCCEGATVVTDFSDLERLGRSHYLDTHGGSAPTEVYEALNGEGIARELLQSGAGKVTPYGVLYENGMQIEQVYAGQSFPPYADKAYRMELELAPAPTAPEDAPPTALFLPTPQERLDRLLERGGYRGAEDVRVTAWRSGLPDGVNDWLNIPREGLRELNRFCQAVEGMGAPELAHLAAAALLAQPEDAEQLRRLAENLGSFEFVPNVGTAEELGRFMIQQSGHFEYDPNLEGFYDYAKYGKQRLEQQNGGFTELGYVCYTGTRSIEELMLEGPAKQVQREEQTQTMGQTMRSF